MKLALLTKMNSAQAASADDSAENVALFETAMKSIREEFGKQSGLGGGARRASPLTPSRLESGLSADGTWPRASEAEDDERRKHACSTRGAPRCPRDGDVRPFRRRRFGVRDTRVGLRLGAAGGGAGHRSDGATIRVDPDRRCRRRADTRIELRLGAAGNRSGAGAVRAAVDQWPLAEKCV